MNGQKVIPLKSLPLELHTSRLHLRQITKDDAETIVELRSSPESYRFFRAPHRLTLAEHMRWYAERYCTDENRIDWIALCEEKPIGLFGLRRASQEQPCCVEISYLLTPAQQGKGYAAEAAEALLHWAATTWSARQAFAEINQDNCASLKFIERMGFSYWKREGEFVFYQRAL